MFFDFLNNQISYSHLYIRIFINKFYVLKKFCFQIIDSMLRFDVFLDSIQKRRETDAEFKIYCYVPRLYRHE